MSLENKIGSVSYETKQEFMDRVEKSYGILDYYSIRPSDEIIEKTYDITNECPIQGNIRSSTIHRWINNNISYKSGRGHKYKIARETFEQRNGNCVDMSYLFLSMTLIAGNYTSRICLEESHCYNYLGSLDSYVDCTNRNGFGVTKRKKHYIISTIQKADEYFEGYCINHNNGNLNAAFKFDERVERESINPEWAFDAHFYNIKLFIFRKLVPYGLTAALTYCAINTGLFNKLSKYSLKTRDSINELLKINNFTVTNNDSLLISLSEDLTRLRYKTEN